MYSGQYYKARVSSWQKIRRHPLERSELPRGNPYHQFEGEIMSRILLTGASGFVGQRLLPRLLANGKAVTIAARDTYPKERSGGDVRLVRISGITSNTDWREALADCTTVVHLAAQVPGKSVEPRTFDEVNNLGTARLVEQAQAGGVQAVVLLSSIFALVDNAAKEPLGDFSLSTARSLYGLSKLAAERHVSAFSKAGRLGVSLRPPLVYGSAAKGNWRLLQRLAASPLPLPFGSVHNKRSLISVDNLVDAIISVLVVGEAAASGEFAVSENVPVSLEQIVSLSRAGMGRPRRLVPVPPSLLEVGLAALGRRQMALSLLDDLVVDSSRFQNVYRWSPAMETPEGIKRSASDFSGLSAV